MPIYNSLLTILYLPFNYNKMTSVAEFLILEYAAYTQFYLPVDTKDFLSVWKNIKPL